jgi:small subunit ribosomal protein S18
MPKEYTKKSSDDKDSKYSSRDRDDKYDDMGMDDDGGGRGGRKFGGNRKKACRFTTGEEDIANLTYKNPKFLSTFMTEHGKIVPRRVTGNCAYIQRILAQEIKRARHLSLLGYTSIGPNSNY